MKRGGSTQIWVVNSSPFVVSLKWGGVRNEWEKNDEEQLRSLTCNLCQRQGENIGTCSLRSSSWFCWMKIFVCKLQKGRWRRRWLVIFFGSLVLQQDEAVVRGHYITLVWSWTWVWLPFIIMFFLLFFLFCLSERVESGGRKGRSTLGCVWGRCWRMWHIKIYFSFGKER